MPKQRKKRKVWVATLLSFFMPGLGQLYNGQHVKAGVILSLCTLLLGVIFLSPLLSSSTGLVAAVGLGLLVWLISIGDALMSARKLGEIELRRYNKIALYVVLYVAATLSSPLASATAKSLLGGAFGTRVTPSMSMAPTLVVGDTFFAGPLPLTGGAASRGEILIFGSPHDPNMDLVKRVIGLEGDVLEIRDGRLFVNDEPVPRCHLGAYRVTETNPLTGAPEVLGGELFLEYLGGRTYPVLINERNGNWGPERVAPGQVFFIGDNRFNSRDSRYFGGIPLEYLRSRPLYRFERKSADSGFGFDQFGMSLYNAEHGLGSFREAIERCRSNGFPNESSDDVD